MRFVNTSSFLKGSLGFGQSNFIETYKFRIRNRDGSFSHYVFHCKNSEASTHEDKRRIFHVLPLLFDKTFTQRCRRKTPEDRDFSKKREIQGNEYMEKA